MNYSINLRQKMTSDRSDTYMINTLDPPESQMRKSAAKSEIAEFYNGTNVLVTGGTGFLGALLIEKLLRLFLLTIHIIILFNNTAAYLIIRKLNSFRISMLDQTDLFILIKLPAIVQKEKFA